MLARRGGRETASPEWCLVGGVSGGGDPSSDPHCALPMPQLLVHLLSATNLVAADSNGTTRRCPVFLRASLD